MGCVESIHGCARPFCPCARSAPCAPPALFVGFRFGLPEAGPCHSAPSRTDPRATSSSPFARTSVISLPPYHLRALSRALAGGFLLLRRINDARRLVDHLLLRLDAGEVGVLRGDLLLLPAGCIGRVVHPR